MTYALWDLGSGNLIESFDNEHDAFMAVREEVALNNDADDLGLEVHHPDGHVSVVAGSDLLELLYASSPSASAV